MHAQASRPIAEGVDDEGPEPRAAEAPLLAEASDISLQDPSASEAGPLPNAPPTVPEDQEVPAKPYGRLPSLSGGGSTPGTLALRTVNRYSPLSEVGTESEYRLAVPSATVLNSESHDPEGINLQLQDWYR